MATVLRHWHKVVQILQRAHRNDDQRRENKTTEGWFTHHERTNERHPHPELNVAMCPTGMKRLSFIPRSAFSGDTILLHDVAPINCTYSERGWGHHSRGLSMKQHCGWWRRRRCWTICNWLCRRRDAGVRSQGCGCVRSTVGSFVDEFKFKATNGSEGQNADPQRLLPCQCTHPNQSATSAWSVCTTTPRAVDSW